MRIISGVFCVLAFLFRLLRHCCGLQWSAIHRRCHLVQLVVCEWHDLVIVSIEKEGSFRCERSKLSLSTIGKRHHIIRLELALSLNLVLGLLHASIGNLLFTLHAQFLSVDRSLNAQQGIRSNHLQFASFCIANNDGVVCLQVTAHHIHLAAVNLHRCTDHLTGFVSITPHFLVAGLHLCLDVVAHSVKHAVIRRTSI